MLALGGLWIGAPPLQAWLWWGAMGDAQDRWSQDQVGKPVGACWKHQRAPGSSLHAVADCAEKVLEHVQK